MGSVWLAQNEVTEREFAIKFLLRGATNPDLLKRFFQEAKVAGRLRHPSIVEIFDAGTDPELGDAPYLVMELLDGIGLDEAIARAGRLPLGVTLEIIAEISRALSLAHAQGIIHRDLKPSNVFLHRIGTGALVPKVLDFGISKVLTDTPSLDMTGKTKEGVTTRTGAVMGSPLYMSPEQAAGDKTIDARSDVHSLGVMLWECLVGKPPFLADTYGLLIVQIIQGPRPRLEEALPGAPQAVCDIVDRAMSGDRNRRYGDAGELAEALEGVLTSMGHRSLLGTRSGDKQFFALLEGKTPAPRPRSTTTAAVEVPQSPSTPPGVVNAASNEHVATPESIHIPEKKVHRGLLAMVAVIAVGAAALAGYALVQRSPSSASETKVVGSEADAQVVSAVTAEVEAGMAPSASTEPSVAPEASSAPKKAPVVAVKPPVTKPPVVAVKPPVTKPPVTKPPPAASAPVHHGITNSGL